MSQENVEVVKELVAASQLIRRRASVGSLPFLGAGRPRTGPDRTLFAMSRETGKRTLVPILIGAALAAIAWLAVPPAAVASRTQRAMFEEDVGMLQNPART